MHRPVLIDEVVQILGEENRKVYVDGTAGGGGHAASLLEAAGPEGRLLAVDRDPEALARARLRLDPWAAQCAFAHGNFADIGRIAAGHGFCRVDGVLFDLGVSSDQLDDPRRGFSLTRDGPLDMRMDPTSPTPTAADLVNALPAQELASLLWEMGEEPAARAVARAIERERQREPIRTTARLARIVERAKGGRRERIHPATRTFQALRIAVNGELDALRAALPAALGLLGAGGRLAVIAFHSLEDRIVKEFFRIHAGRWQGAPGGGRDWIGELPRVREVTRKPIRPSETEREQNPRARSARLRAAERMD